jgi:hypothetical protein
MNQTDLQKLIQNNPTLKAKNKHLTLTPLADMGIPSHSPPLGDGGDTPPPKKKSKYHAQKTDADGITFDSKKESQRYQELKLLLNAGKIGFLAMQVEFAFHIKDQKVSSYFADFVYLDADTGNLVVEDVKSEATRTLPVYRLKKKMMFIEHKIKIQEI